MFVKKVSYLRSRISDSEQLLQQRDQEVTKVFHLLMPLSQRFETRKVDELRNRVEQLKAELSLSQKENSSILETLSMFYPC